MNWEPEAGADLASSLAAQTSSLAPPKSGRIRWPWSHRPPLVVREFQRWAGSAGGFLNDARYRFETPRRTTARPQRPMVEGGGDPAQGRTFVAQPTDFRQGTLLGRIRFQIPLQFEFAKDFSEGVAAVKVGGKFGYNDKAGKIVINPQFDDAGEFSGGLAWVLVAGKQGYIDKDGKYVWNPSN